MANGMSTVINSDSPGSDGESKDYYWAQETRSTVLASSVIRRIKAYRENMRLTGLSTRIRKSWSALMGYGPRSDADASRITNTGDIGELLNVTINDYGALLNQVLTLTTGNKPATKAIARNSDFASLASAQFAESLNDYYDSELRVSDREFEVTEMMVALGEGHLALEWDAAIGQPFTVAESGKVVRSGDVRIFSVSPFDIARDPHLQDIESQTWAAFRRKVSKWELVALYPEKKEQILAHSLRLNDSYNDGIDGQSFTGDEFSLDFRQKNPTQSVSNDAVYLWEFRHKPTPAVPNGRLLKFLGAECVLFDSVKTTPAGLRDVVRATPDASVEEVVQEWQPEFVEDKGYPYGDSLFFISSASKRTPGGIDGRTEFFDLLSMQEGVDLSFSIMSSAINAGGLQNLYVPRGSNVTANKLTGALNVIEYDGDQVPEAKDNVAINPAVVAFADKMAEHMRQRVALNEVTTGDMQRAMPAQAMALLRAQSIEFHSRLQAAYEDLLKRSRTGIIKLLQLFADTERVALIAGKANTWALKEFKSRDLEGFDRFIIEPVNPMMKTLAGKVSFALPLLEKGIITPEQYLALGNTGRMEPIDKFASDNRARIEREKEKLMRGVGLPPLKIDPMGAPVISNDGLPELDPVAAASGEFVIPLLNDPFWVDIPEYARLLEQPGVRSQPAVVQATQEVIHRCMMLWSKQPIAMTMLLGGKPYPSQMMMMQQMGAMPPDVGGLPQPSGAPGEMKPPTQPGPPAPRGTTPPGGPNVKQPSPPKLRMADPQLQRVAEENPPPTQ